MKKNRFATLLCLSVASMYGATQIGCSKQDPAGASTTASNVHTHDDHGDGDHDHGDHAESGHDHPAHGIRGGHLINLSGDKEVEVQFSDDTDKFVIHVADAAKPDTVTKVVMSTTVDGKVSDYLLKKAETDDGVVYEITSPALATAVKMGDVVKTTLTISTKDGEISGSYKHHAH